MGNKQDSLQRLKDQLLERLKFWGNEITDADIMDFTSYDLTDYIQDHDSFFPERESGRGGFLEEKARNRLTQGE